MPSPPEADVEADGPWLQRARKESVRDEKGIHAAIAHAACDAKTRRLEPAARCAAARAQAPTRNQNSSARRSKYPSTTSPPPTYPSIQKRAPMSSPGTGVTTTSRASGTKDKACVLSI